MASTDPKSSYRSRGCEQIPLESRRELVAKLRRQEITHLRRGSLGEARIAEHAGHGAVQLGYLSNADPNDPMVSPAMSKSILAKFPPTLLITGDRDFAFSGAIHTDVQLARLGVETELHMWDGLFHGFFYNADVPESKEAFAIMSRFFERHLEK